LSKGNEVFFGPGIIQGTVTFGKGREQKVIKLERIRQGTGHFILEKGGKISFKDLIEFWQLDDVATMLELFDETIDKPEGVAERKADGDSKSCVHEDRRAEDSNLRCEELSMSALSEREEREAVEHPMAVEGVTPAPVLKSDAERDRTEQPFPVAWRGLRREAFVIFILGEYTDFQTYQIKLIIKASYWLQQVFAYGVSPSRGQVVISTGGAFSMGVGPMAR